MTKDDLLRQTLTTQFGALTLVGNAAGCLYALALPGRAPHARYDAAREAALPAAITEPISAYCDGELGALDRIACDPYGTPFQKSVWSLLRRIPPGSTSTYGALAIQLENPGAMRAVGAANGANPIAIVIPCHRVIGADGTLTGFGGGLPMKEALLAHEGAAPTLTHQRDLFA